MKELIIMIGIVSMLLIAGCTQAPMQDQSTEVPDDAQVVMLGLDREGYTPKEIVVEANRPVLLKADKTLGGCAKHLVQKELGINANFVQNTEYLFTPTKKGEFTIACSMGMWQGTMKVV